MTKKEAIKEYIKLLEDELGKAAAFLDAHGFITESKVIKRGEELRTIINAEKNE